MPRSGIWRVEAAAETRQLFAECWCEGSGVGAGVGEDGRQTLLPPASYVTRGSRARARAATGAIFFLGVGVRPDKDISDGEIRSNPSNHRKQISVQIEAKHEESWVAKGDEMVFHYVTFSEWLSGRE